jgi:hypothetical protein
MKLPRKAEILFNRIRYDLIYRNHLYSHNFARVNDPSCQMQISQPNNNRHLFFNCPLIDQARDNLFNDLGLLPSSNNLFISLTNLEAKLQVLLNGHYNHFPRHENYKIIEKVGEFILDINTIILLLLVVQSFKQN